MVPDAVGAILPARLASVTLPFDANSGSPLSLLLLGQPDQAEEEALRNRKAGNRDENDAFIWLSLAIAAQRSGDLKRALRLADAARMADPRDPLVWARIGSLRLADGAVKGAVAAAEHALELSPVMPGLTCSRLGLSAARTPRGGPRHGRPGASRGPARLTWPGGAKSSGAHAELPRDALDIAVRCWPATGPAPAAPVPAAATTAS